VLVLVTTTLPNDNGPPVTLTTAIAGTANSTAPKSTEPLAFLGVSKKSLVGAAA
jgi:hypothetical protein